MPKSAGTQWEQIAEDLWRRVNQGEWPGDVRLPSEVKLAEHYGVHRDTVREALQDLTVRGVLISGRGQGRKVRRYERIEFWPADFEHRSKRQDDPERGHDAWKAHIASQGHVGNQEVETSIAIASSFMAHQLQVVAGDTVLRRSRTRQVNDEYWEIGDSYYPMWLVEGEGKILLQPGDVTVPGGFMKFLGHEQSWFDDYTIGRMPSPEESRRLRLGEITPVIEHQRTGYDLQGVPVRVIVTVLRADKYVLRHRIEAK